MKPLSELKPSDIFSGQLLIGVVRQSAPLLEIPLDSIYFGTGGWWVITDGNKPYSFNQVYKQRCIAEARKRGISLMYVDHTLWT